MSDIETVFIKDGTEYASLISVTGIYVGLLVFSGICILVFLLSPLDDDCEWEFNKIYWDCLVSLVSLDREGDKIYYHYNGKLLYTYLVKDHSKNSGNKGLLRHELYNIVLDFKRSPNLYEEYKGTKAKNRQKNIDSVIDNE